MRIPVRVIFAEEQHVAVAHELNNLWISLEHTEPGEVFDLWRKLARVIDRTIDFQSVLFADYKIVVAVTRRGVHTARPGLTGSSFFTRVFHVQFRFRVGFAAECHVLA